MQKSSAHSMLVFGKSYGIVVGILAALQIKTVEVRSQVWMKAIHGGHHGETTKDRSKAAFAAIFEGVDARRSARAKKNDLGLMEAALIAEFGRRVLTTETKEAHHEQIFGLKGHRFN